MDEYQPRAGGKITALDIKAQCHHGLCSVYRIERHATLALGIENELRPLLVEATKSATTGVPPYLAAGRHTDPRRQVGHAGLACRRTACMERWWQYVMNSMNP